MRNIAKNRPAPAVTKDLTLRKQSIGARRIQTMQQPQSSAHRIRVWAFLEDHLRWKRGLQSLQETPLNSHQPGQLRELVGDLGVSLFAPLAVSRTLCDTLQQDRPPKIVWDMKEGDKSPPFAASTRGKASDSCVTLDSQSLTVSTALEALDYSDVDETDESTMSEVADCPRILTAAMRQQLHESLPESYQLCKWERCFAIGLHGDSYCSLLERCAPYARSFLVVQTTEGHVLGGFATRRWQQQASGRQAYFGTGQSFLFASHPRKMTGDDTDAEHQPLQIFPWTGANDFCQICEPDRLAMGGGTDFGFIVQDHMGRGRTGASQTFGNPPLAPTDSFEIAAMEVYGLLSWGDSLSSSPGSSTHQSTHSSTRSASSFFGLHSP